MKIAATSVSMEAAHTFRELEHQKVQTQIGNLTNTFQGGGFGSRLSRLVSSSTHQQLQSQSSIQSFSAEDQCQGSPDVAAASTTLLTLLAENTLGTTVTMDSILEHNQNEGGTAGFQGGRISLMQLTSSQCVEQEERLEVSAQGTVCTEDGREICFSFGLEVERRTVSMNSAFLGSIPVLLDPIILQFEGDAPMLTDASFHFDLNGDGEDETLASLGRGCGFLAMDRNADGVINNGLELFGPGTGFGFDELAAFDNDSNQWIDENDPVFAKLQIWRPGEEGEGALLSLKEAGVGAISVAACGTSFNLEGSQGRLLGQVRATSIFIMESGEVRSLQEVELAVKGEEVAGTLSEETDQSIIALRSIIEMQRFRLRLLMARNQVARAETTMDKWQLTVQHTRHSLFRADHLAISRKEFLPS